MRFTIIALVVASACLHQGCGGSGSASAQAVDASLLFDGDDFVQIDPFPKQDGDMAIEFWVRIDGATAPDGQRILVQLGDEWAITALDGVPMVGPLPGAIQTHVGSAGARSTDVQLSADTWHHIAVNYEEYGSIQLYLDGVFIDTDVQVDQSPEFASMRIGGGGFMGLGGFRGRIDELRVWDHPRESVDIAAFRGVVLPSSTSGLLAYYRFSRDAGQAVIDGSAATRDGVLGGTAEADTDDPARVAGGAPVQ